MQRVFVCAPLVLLLPLLDRGPAGRAVPVEAVEDPERVVDRLVHVEVLVVCQPAHEVHALERLLVRERLVLGVQRVVARVRHRVVRLAVRAARLAHHDGVVAARLAGVVLILSRASEGDGHLGVVDRRAGLVVPVLSDVEHGQLLEAERAVRQLRQARVGEVVVDRAGENELAAPAGEALLHVEPVDAQHEVDERVAQDARHPPCVPVPRLALVAVGEVAVVKVAANRDPPRHERVELRRVDAPLLKRVATVELVVRRPADARHRLLLRV
mmetsp:Transcript_4346/g.12862  ORF Transcript_4346/g.12862 Transcript_4346/m.12862 type:complete len:270 (-) Transcript_4346:765-1574(-)